jgi:sulfoxide reductase heme-binding subunit YedZ
MYRNITYNAHLSGQVTDNTYLGTDDQGYTIYSLMISAALSPNEKNPPLALHLFVSEAFLPGITTQQQQDVLPGGGTVMTTGFLRGTATITNEGGTMSLYAANANGLDLVDGSMHVDLEGTGTGKASGGKSSLYLTIAPLVGDQASGQASGSLDMPQAAFDLITSTDPLVSPTVWYILRASGLAALALLSLVVLIGLALRVRLWKERLERWRVYDVHLTLSLLTGVFLAIHLLLVFLDRIVPFSLADLLIPLHASYQPLWIAAGIVALYLLLIVWGSSLLRAKIGHRLWRSLHPLALGALGLVMLHALFAGTDGPTLWLRGALVVVTIAALWLFERWMRLRTVEEAQRRRRGTSSRQPPVKRRPAPQLYSQVPNYPSQAGWRSPSASQESPRRVSQE